MDDAEDRPRSNIDPEQALIDFVTSKLEYMKQFMKFGAGKEISFYELEDALKEYQNVYFSLISMENIAKIKYRIEQESFNTWFGEKFLSVRAETNKIELTAQKWASAKELDYMVVAKYKEEYTKRKSRLLSIEMEHQVIEDILTAWKAHAYNLKLLSDNLRSETGMSGIESRR
jgi:preprotein translocase subunit SecA